jgi:DNA-binding winged helix-turn-helix (wHTH) protein/WD40 repeat protein
MEETKRPFPPTRFGLFEVDLQAGELRRQGYKVKLQEQPFQVLAMLLERPGEVVTREELQRKLWPADTFVDFERGLNGAINKLREALGDNAVNPRFIETLPKRGYRFVMPVETKAGAEEQIAGKNRLVLIQPEQPHPARDGVPANAIPKRVVVPWAVAGALAMIATLVYWRPWGDDRTVAARPLQRLDLEVGLTDFSQPAISADGMRIALVTKGGLAIRRLDQVYTSRLAGTEGAHFPFFSPDGRWIAFFAAGKLRKVAVEGGTPITLADAPGAAGGTWSDDSIVAALDAERGLSRLPAAGGVPQLLTNATKDTSGIMMHCWPQALRGGKSILFTAINGSWRGSVQVVTPGDGALRTVIENSNYGRYVADGYVVFNQQGTLLAAPVDPRRIELLGPGVPFVYSVSYSEDRAEFDLSESGTLVYRRGAERNTVPSWLSRSGKVEPVFPRPGNYSLPRLSPDGTRLALALTRGAKQHIWVYDLIRETWNRLTSEDGPEWLPTWTPDGEFLAFRSGTTLAWTRSDGSGKVERLDGVSRNTGPWSFSPDGKWLAFWPLEPNSDLWIAPVERTPGILQLGRPRLLLQLPGSKGTPAISPDGRWLAYNSAKPSGFEVYVVPFSPQRKEVERKWLVSNAGGCCPVWSPNRRELLYAGADRRIHVAAYTTQGGLFVAQKPELWSEKEVDNSEIFPAFDVAPDGKRVLALFNASDPGAETHVRILLNVDSELRRIAPVHHN